MGTKLGTSSHTSGKGNLEMYPPGMELHGSRWRIKKRIPQDLLEHYQPSRFLSHNTGTGDKKEAAVICLRWLSEVEEEFDRLRKTGSKYKQGIPSDDLSRLVRLMVASSLAADEEARAEGIYADDAAYAHALEALAAIESDSRLTISRRILGEAAEVAQDWLIGHGYDIPEDSPAFREIALQFAKGRLEASKVKRARNAGEWVETPSASVAPAAGIPLLSSVVASFLDKQNHAAPMFKKYAVALRLFLAVLGDRPVSSIKQADIDGFFTLLCKLPPRWSDEARKRGRGVPELAAMEWSKRVGPKTFEDSYKASLRPFLAESRRLYGDQGFPLHLTTDGIKYSGTRTEGDAKQRPMKAQELKRLFDGAEVAAFAADIEQAHCYWLPLVGLYTGARVNEVCQINPQHDIVEEDGIWCFHFTEETPSDPRIRKSVRIPRKLDTHSRANWTVGA